MALFSSQRCHGMLVPGGQGFIYLPLLGPLLGTA